MTKTLVVMISLVCFALPVFASKAAAHTAKVRAKVNKPSHPIVIKPIPLAQPKRGPSQKEILEIETKALKSLLENNQLKAMKNSDGTSAEAIILQKVSEKERETKILDLEDKILMSDYVLATYKDLNQWQDLKSKKDGTTLITEERAKKRILLEQLKAEQLRLTPKGHQ